ncbi:MAG: flavodoxin family protein [Candidatus Brockarchaeota archaeon]|nr:flavodoxin family protein [Candidatus Brockarchaeota archaeon]
MKIAGLSCSARKNGNTANAIGIALNYLSGKGVETRLVHLTDYSIKPVETAAWSTTTIRSVQLQTIPKGLLSFLRNMKD